MEKKNKKKKPTHLFALAYTYMQTLWVHTNTDCLDICLSPLVQPLSSPFVAALGNICSTDDDKTLLLYS